MDEKQRAAMRNSFKRVSAIGLSATPLRLSDSDIKALAAIGIAEPTVEPYAPVSIEEARRLLEDVASSYSRSKLDNYLDDAQYRVMEAIVKPFGLAKVLFEDKDGGNVTTVRNAKEGVFANSADEERYNRCFDRKDYEHDFPAMRKKLFQNSEQITDAYTGREIAKDGTTHLDHVISASEIHKDNLLRLCADNDQRNIIATNESNLVATNSSLNQSKNDNDLMEWMNDIRKDGKTNAEYFGVNADSAEDVYRNARKHYEIEKAKAVTKHFGKELSTTGLQEATKMGLQQAMGVLFLELSRSLMNEIRDALSSGVRTESNQSLIQALVERLKRVGNNVLSKWKDVVVAFKDGAVSGFLSNIITFLINNFIKTTKNAVRMIREGFMSLVHGFKFIINPPAGYSRNEAFHESGKIVIGGLAVGLGILAEETVTKGIAAIPIIGQIIQPFAGHIAPVLVGIVVGLGTCFLCYLWDKLDLFGAEEGRRHKFIMDTLERQKNAASDAADNAVAERDRLVQDCDKMIAEIEEVDRQFWALAGA